MSTIDRRLASAAEPPAEPALEPAPGGIGGIAWLNRDLFWLFALRVIRSFAQGYLGVITPLYIAMLGYDAVHLGILFAVSAMVAAALSTATGLLSDRFGRKLFLAIISVLMGIGGVWFGLTRNFAAIVAAGAIGSIGRGGAIAGGAWGPFYPAAQALVAEQTRDYERTSVFGALSFVGVMSAAVGSLLATVPKIVQHAFGLPLLEGYRLLFLLVGPFGVAMAFAVIPVRELHVGQPRAAQNPSTPADQRPIDPKLVLGLSPKSWQLVWRFMVTNATNGAAIGMLGPFVVYWFYRRFGVTATELGTLFFVLNLISSVPYLMAGRIALMFGSVRSVVVTRAIGTILLFAVAVMPTFLSAAALYAIRIVFNVISLPVRQSYLMGVIDPAERASAAGLANLPSQITSAAGPYVAGYFMQHIALALPLEFAAAMQGINALLYWLFFRNVYPPEEADSFGASSRNTGASVGK
jgi:MFS family permease